MRICETVTDGLPFFRGPLTLSQTLWLDNPNVRITLACNFLTAKVQVNGHDAGEIFFQTTLDISPWAVEGNNELQITFIIGNRNLLGPHHSKENEEFVCPDSFLRNDLPGAAKLQPKYKFQRFHIKANDI